jgi:hypothetical protein
MKTKLITTILCLIAAAAASAVYGDESSSKDDSCLIFPKVDVSVEQPAASGGGEESCAGKYFRLIRRLEEASGRVAAKEKYSPDSSACLEKSAADNGRNAANTSAGSSNSTPGSYPDEMRILLLLQAAILIPAILVGVLKIVA